MEKNQPHEVSAKTRKKVKYIMFGISALTLVSAIFMPWSFLTSKEIVLSLMGLLFINGFLIWSYFIQFVWRQQIFNYLECKYNVKIVVRTAGSLTIIGEVSIMTKLFIHLLILSYYIIGMIGPLALYGVTLFLLIK